MANLKDDLRHEDLEGYDSSFEGDDECKKSLQSDSGPGIHSLTKTVQGTSAGKGQQHSAGLPPKSFYEDQLRRAESYRNHYLSLNAYERHKKLINDYVLYYPGSASQLKRDSTKDKNDRDIIQDNHRFLWDDSEDPSTWEKQLAKKYYDKLFKEYGLCDLTRYVENKIAIRWRTEKEVIDGKGQFVCGEKKCDTKELLRTWEVNFAYMEESVKKNALVKLRLCTACSVKLNFNHQKKEVIKKSKKRRSSEIKISKTKKIKTEPNESQKPNKNSTTKPEEIPSSSSGDNIWKETVVLPELKSREEEFDEYLDDLFL